MTEIMPQKLPVPPIKKATQKQSGPKTTNMKIAYF